MDFGRPESLRGAAITHDGRVVLMGPLGPKEPVSAYLATTYERESGKPKVVSKTPLSSTKLVIDPTTALQRFDILIAVDTNTKTIAGHRVSCTCVVRGDIEETPFRRIGTVSPRQIYEQHGLMKSEEERLGWLSVILSLPLAPNYSDRLRVGMVVDAHLGSLEDFNARRQPILDDDYLPPNIELLYASADVAGGLTNAMLRAADTIATAMLDDIASGELGDYGLIECVDPPPTHARIWYNLVVDGKQRWIPADPASIRSHRTKRSS